MSSIDLMTWFCERCLPFKPVHFVTAKTPLTKESQLWIYNTLRGRFAIVMYDSGENIINTNLLPAFEDPQEAVFYELTWS